MNSKILRKILLSGGGTGGHIFPAIAIAEELKKRFPQAEFLFIGAKDKMEMQKIPEAGFPIKGLWISGINRSSIKENLLFPLKLISSLWNSYKIIKKFNPDIAIGTGGFASGPSLWIASFLKIPIFIQEQNSFPGITNKFLAKKAKAICVAYNNLENHFPKNKIYLTGNPIRENLINNLTSTHEAKLKIGLDPDKLCVLSIGGSLGSRTLNQFWENTIDKISNEKIQIIWQTGKLDFNKYKQQFPKNNFGILTDFLTDMNSVYSAADIIISRAGAIAISELCVVGKPTILVPFPFAAEDHQTKNAEYLVEKNAAILIKDKQVSTELFSVINHLIEDKNYRNLLSENIKKLSKTEASKEIIDVILNNFK